MVPIGVKNRSINWSLETDETSYRLEAFNQKHVYRKYNVKQECPDQ